MHIDELTKIAENFTRTALCGVTKEQILRTYKEAYNLSDNEIKALLILCNFKSAPKSINYEYFYNNPLIYKTEKIPYPFTQIYFHRNFLTDYECKELIECINKSTRKSTLANDKDELYTSDYRTSETADLHFFPAELILDIDNKLEDLTELDPFIGEAMQAQKYKPG